MKKSIFLLMLVLALMVSTMGVQAQEAPITIELNGQNLTMDQPPVMLEGRTLVPVRVIFEALGAEIEWIAESETVVATRDDVKIVLVMGSNTALINEDEVTLDMAAQTIGGRTMVPTRFVAESLKADVDWDGEARRVVVKSEGAVADEVVEPVEEEIVEEIVEETEDVAVEEQEEEAIEEEVNRRESVVGKWHQPDQSSMYLYAPEGGYEFFENGTGRQWYYDAETGGKVEQSIRYEEDGMGGFNILFGAGEDAYSFYGTFMEAEMVPWMEGDYDTLIMIIPGGEFGEIFIHPVND